MTTEERLANLEKGMARAKRRNCWLLAALGLALGALVLAGTLTPKTAGAQGGGVAVNEIRAQRLVLVDDEGRERAVLAAHKDGAGLNLLDEDGKNRAALAVTKDGPRLTLLDKNGKIRAGLAVYAVGPRLFLTNEAGKKIWSAPERGS